MKTKISFALIAAIFLSCSPKEGENDTKVITKRLVGSWKLLSGTVIEKGDTTVTHYTKNVSFIKIINDTHFAFLQHDLHKGKDSAAVFVAGGGSYSLKDNMYTERLQYCSAREWEGNHFAFTISIKNDTLIQPGIEKVESVGLNRVNIEKYVKIEK